MDNSKYIDRKNAMRYMGCPNGIPSGLEAAVEECESELCRVMTPRYTYVVRSYEDAARILSGEDIARHLSGCHKVAVMAVTLGASVDELIRKYQSGDVARAVITDAEASAAVEVLCDCVQREIESASGERTTTRFSPGYGDYPLTLQQDVLDFVDAGRKIGLFTGAGGMMTPSKSVTAVVGIGNDGPSRSAGCAECGMKDTCANRKDL